MVPLRPFVAALSALAVLTVSAQNILIDGEMIPANETTVAPAAEPIAVAGMKDTVESFEEELVQLTDAVLANLTELQLSSVSLFQFGDDSSVEGRPIEARAQGRCKTFPGDFLWPHDIIWKLFDVLLGGALVKTVPIAAPCYDSFGVKNPSECAFLTANWGNNSFYHIEHPTSVNAVLFQGQTCMPPTLAGGVLGTDTCSVGGYPEYAVVARNVAHIQLAVNFARSLDIRLVIKNTGHDFGAKSTGAGSLSIWTYNLKSTRFIEKYRRDGYDGPAIKLGAGVQAFEVYEAAHRYGVTVVGGEGQSVGVAGGYIAGGGHSPLSSLYGMAADQVLSLEVVTANGRFVTASPKSHPDLYWALCGGVGSTFGVVTSLTVKAYPKLTISTLTFSFSTGSTVSDEAFWAGVKAYFDGFETYADKGNYGYLRIRNLGPGLGYTFSMQPWFGPGLTKTELQEITKPFFDRLSKLGIAVAPVLNQYDDFYSAWKANFPLGPWGSTTIRQGSRLIPRSVWKDESKLNATFGVIQRIVEEGGYIVGFNIQGKGIRAPNPPDNAVNPAWRGALAHIITAAFWTPSSSEEEIKKASDKLTFDWGQQLRDLTPDSGAYMSESDYIEPDFQQAFFGSKYERLYQIKKRYDPHDIFYATNAVGSENWELQGKILGNLPSQNSKLCRK
ncbi:FAD binding domain-containing protein [Colletotrichum plurivorum]|uniref:FAD binding domain-containing protein n=1 Tax=Colletotrichum plurivorum TaxID=2175906 RepID=A0A8H6KPT4_9PEZI|nr:FAD binding domain-containing protein [Colletotrichum plurivorum]